MRRLIVILWLAGGGLAAAEPNLAEPKVAKPVVAEAIPLPRPRPPLPPAWTEPQSFSEAAGPDFKSAEVTSAPTACNARLEKIAVVTLMPRLMGPGACGGGDMLELEAVLLPDKSRVAVEPPALIHCGMAETLATWLREDAAPRTAALGGRLAKIENYDAYECRSRNRIFGAKLSQHAHGGALDVRAFHLTDGRRLELTDMGVDKPLREGLRESACRRFGTVLGPGSDGHHEAHIHLDVIERRNGYRICQWDVREPPQPPAVPLPPERPVAVAATAAAAETITDAGSAAAPAADPPAAMRVADAAVPLPYPRPPGAGKIRHGKRKPNGSFHLPFTLSR